MGEFSIWHWLIVLLIVVMVFGTKKLKNMGSDLGEAVKGFKQGMQAADAPSTPPQQPAADQGEPVQRVADASAQQSAPGAQKAQQAEDIAFKPKA